MEKKVLETNNKGKVRKSGVELLKIFGIILVVISHVVQTLEYNGTDLLGYNDFHIDLDVPTTNISILILSILRHSGHLGNSIFFLSSAWFLLESKKPNYKKILRMLGDIWVVSVLILLITLICDGERLQLIFILRSLFPTVCFNNWYATTYVIFCFIYPFLNVIINKVDSKKHLLYTLGLLLFFLVLDYFYRLSDFSNIIEPFVNIATWLWLYFTVGFIKKYASKFCSNVKVNLIMCISGIVSLILVIILLNYFGLKYPELEISLLTFNSKSSIFLLVIAFAALNLFNSFEFNSRFINYASGMSLLIYIVHENLIFKRYYRPAIWQWIYLNFGYKNIILWAILFIVVLFIASTLFSYLYRIVFQKNVYHITDKIYDKIEKLIKNKGERKTTNL